MKPIVRILLGVGLVIVGVPTAAFFGLLLLIADCSTRCRANHESLVSIGPVVLGLAIAGVGVLLLTGHLGNRANAASRPRA